MMDGPPSGIPARANFFAEEPERSVEPESEETASQIVDEPSTDVVKELRVMNEHLWWMALWVKISLVMGALTFFVFTMVGL